MNFLSKRNLLIAAGLFSAAVVLVPPAMADLRVAAKPVEITVYKDPDCGCCKNWVEHLRKHGYHVVTHDTRDMASVKGNFGVGNDLQSCHTAIVNGYVIEGHVPAADIARLLKERPKVAGLAVPGMPQGSPGMEGGSVEHYSVIAFDKTGGKKIFARH
jgi:hypothetical protein